MNRIQPSDNADSVPAVTVSGIGQPSDPQPWRRELPAFTPHPLPDEWVVPPDVYHAFSHARTCPDFFAIQAPHAEQRLQLLIHLAKWCPQERWWIIVPDTHRAGELIHAWPDPTPCLLLLTNHSAHPQRENPPQAITLDELRDQIASQVRSRLQERLQLLQQLQTITLELIQCDTIQAELTATLETLERSILAEIEDEDSSLHRRCTDRVAPLQRRILECETRRSQLQEKLRLEQSPSAHKTQSNYLQTSPGWFARLKKWLRGRFCSTSTDADFNDPCSGQNTSRVQSLHEELQATEKELADLQSTQRAEHQRLLEQELFQRRQVLQERLIHQRAEHERLNAERERLIEHLSLTPVDGPTIEHELAQVQRQLREIEPIITHQIQRQLQEIRLVIGVASEWEDLLRFRTLVGSIERIVYESCEQMPEGLLQKALAWPARHLLMGNILASDSWKWAENGTYPESYRTSKAIPWLARLTLELDQRPWLVEGDCLIVRLRSCPLDQRPVLRSEPLADHPEVMLRFWDISERETELVEIVFPRTWGFAARVFVAQQLEYYRPAPCGPAHWHESTSGDIRVCWPVVERFARLGLSETIDWGNGVQEWCFHDGQTFYTAALTFRVDWGWDRSKAEAWLQELLPPATQQRLAVVTSRLPLPCETVHSHPPSSSSPAISASVTIPTT
jgi:hypothetical protein